jgi:O-antigen/teichoic acid export membrane protein
MGRGVTIGAGLLLHGTGLGLLFGELANRITYFSGLMLSGIYRKVRLLWRVFSWRSSWEAVQAYKDFPLYVLPANYMNVLSAQVPIFMLTSKFGATVVGLYAFSVSLLEMPLNLVGSAIAPVFMQKATEVQHDDPDRLKDITLSLYNKMLYLGLLPFGFLTVFGDVLFRIVFGAKWEMAGMFTAYLGYYYIFKLTSTVTAPIYTVIEKQRYALISTVMLLAARAGGLFIGLALNDVNKALLLFGAGSLIVTFLTDLHILYLLRAPVMRIAVRTVVLVVVTVTLMYGLRIFIHSFLPKWV